MPLADIGAEFLFPVISDQAERAALIVTTNLPFSEWTSVFPNPRLCKALLDRITDRLARFQVCVWFVAQTPPEATPLR